jgi:hypothetical protein
MGCATTWAKPEGSACVSPAMRWPILLLASVWLLPSACKSSEAAEPTPENGNGVAVVELFTSEGCSSCPSADAVLRDLVQEASPRVYPMAFHVDYWNSIGWADRFSTELYSSRQREYASAFGTSSVYTPQMVVEGTEGFVGSDRGQARAAIARALARAPRTTVKVSAEAGASSNILAHVHLDPPLPDAVVRAAVVERGLSTRVASGENAGKLLLHENVVRAFATASARGSDVTLTLAVPSEVDRHRADVIAFVQAAPSPGKGMSILGAAKASAPPEP